ncbi:uncharacterized protein RHOBADRAFT_53522 [Rhodotorula graminis WP1]|uniref:CFA20 domain-containing protein n=1 Tax=Rhodotorula graminis (strain WP1) TaxID=578459 RepID=A0A194S822_RHOGW|nr:uncharacterized protein RHOBADRAFT_53522 [Rhodotorula graminis WP1]KPV75556.1 hypothetical protein RHOBADRAFT_53522 [Rhodotorula graminis WP1]
MLLDHVVQLARCTAAGDAVTDSFISLLRDASDDHETLVAWNGAADSELSAARVDSLRRLRRGLAAGTKDLDGQVMHLQAPDCRTTSVRWGSLSPRDWREDGLGVELPAVHFQLKHLEQTMYLEVAVVDERGEVMIVRCSTFQTAPELLPSTEAHPRLLHFPLLFPLSDSSVPLLTSWCTITLPLRSLLLSLTPPVKLKCVVGVAVHATCRLRRVWFSEEDAPAEVDEALLLRGGMPELALFAAVEGQAGE